MPDYRKLRVHTLAEALSVEVHLLASRFPTRKSPGLVAQVCRAVSSIPANIAEGAGRESPVRYLQFLYTARGSAQEASVHLRLAARVDDKRATAWMRCEQQANVVAAMLVKLIQRIEADEAQKG